MKYSTEIRKAPNGNYLKVFFLNECDAEKVQKLIGKISSVKKANITMSESMSHPGQTLTVYPKSMVSVENVNDEVKCALDAYYSGIVEKQLDTNTDVHFQSIEQKILNALDNEKAIIYVCVAWFTNEKIKAKLEEKQKDGCDVRVIVDNNHTNRKKGVDLSNLKHKLIDAERNGIMHRKFCVIDNCDVLDGSYNWTTNAETRNDEDIMLHTNDRELASKYTKEFNRMWNNQITES